MSNQEFTDEQREAMRRYKQPFIDKINTLDIVSVLDLEKARNSGYICPCCGSGQHKNGTGAQVTNDHKRITCFANPDCKLNGEGHGQDIYGALQAVTGKSGDAILKEYFPGYDISAALKSKTMPAESVVMTIEAGNGQQAVDTTMEAENAVQPDHTAYYEECSANINDPAAQEYLSFRGISKETAAAFNIGYDTKTRFIVIPVSDSFYIARNTDRTSNMRYKNPAGVSIELFNLKALYNDAARPVFITEGVIDALSIIEAGGVAIATNSTSNAHKLIRELEQNPTKNSLIIAMDDDAAGNTAKQILIDGLTKLSIPFICADIYNGKNDANDALIADRSAFIEAVTTTEKKVRFPGLLTTERAIQILEDVDYTYLNMPLFPQLSAMIKVRVHDTVVIAADTGAGKSSLALNFLHELQDRYPTMYINLEMDEATVLQRLVAIHTGMELDKIEGYKNDENTRKQVDQAIRQITGRREIQLLEDVYSIKDIEAQIITATQGRSEPTLVFIDTGLLVTPSGKASSRYERFTEISEELRRISRLNNIIMFVLLQQNRAGKAEEQKAPTNSSLKESGSWENDATKIVFLWTNDKDNKELVITKNRSGKTGNIELNYTPETQSYREAQKVPVRRL